MIDTKIKPATCPRCSDWLLAATVCGGKVAVTAQPLTPDEYRHAVVIGRPVYVVRRKILVPIDPWRLPRPGEALLGAHPCGKAGLNAKLFEDSGPGRSLSPCDGRLGCPRAHESGLLLGGAETAAQDSGAVDFMPVSCNGCDPPPF